MPDQPLDDRGLPRGYPFHEAYEVTPREVAANPEAYLIVDVREPAELRLAALENAQHLPLGTIESEHDQLEPVERQRVAVLCHHGQRSLRGALALRQLGFPDAVSIAGGIDLWSRAVDPGIARY